MISKVLFTAFLAITAESLLFSGGVGFSRALRAAKKQHAMGLYAGLVALFSVFSMLCTQGLDQFLLKNNTLAFFRPAVYALFVAGVYLLLAFLLRRFWPRAYRRVARFLSSASINSIVLAMPLISGLKSMNLWESLSYALFTGVSFYLAALVLSQALERCKSPGVPSAFRGLPATILYIGILCLAFVGFSGGALF